MIYAGIDYSLSSPAICVFKGNGKINIDNCHFFYYNTKKSTTGDFKNVHGFLQTPYESEQERHDNISEWAIKILNAYNVKNVCIEDYAMGAKGKIFNIGENTGLLKHKMWKNNISFITVAPTSAKKHFSGKGNASKEEMYNSFLDKTGLDLEDLLNSKAKNNPISDIVDSFAMCEYGMNNL